jgi:transposase
LLRIHILLLCSAGKSPTEIADFLLCSRSTVYRAVDAYHAGEFSDATDDVPDSSLVRTLPFSASLERSIRALLKKPPSAFGWCRTRWSCATLAAQLKVQRGVSVSAETMRRWLHALGYVWKRAKLVARDDDLRRAERLARIRAVAENLAQNAVLLFADELDIHLLPKVGYEWTPKGEEREVMTPGQNAKRYLAGALDWKTGRVLYRIGRRKTSALFVELLEHLNAAYPATTYAKVHVVVDNYGIHFSKAVTQWLAEHPRFELLRLPTYCPKANPIERVFWELHDKCTRNHRRKKIHTLVNDVEHHLEKNGPWRYQMSEIYSAPEVTAAMLLNAAAASEKLAA